MYKLKTGRHFEKSVAHYTAQHHNTNANATTDEKQVYFVVTLLFFTHTHVINDFLIFLFDASANSTYQSCRRRLGVMCWLAPFIGCQLFGSSHIVSFCQDGMLPGNCGRNFFEIFFLFYKNFVWNFFKWNLLYLKVIHLPNLCRSTASMFSPSCPPSPCAQNNNQEQQSHASSKSISKIHNF